MKCYSKALKLVDSSEASEEPQDNHRLVSAIQTTQHQRPDFVIVHTQHGS